jgi:hypothetical protein
LEHEKFPSDLKAKERRETFKNGFPDLITWNMVFVSFLKCKVHSAIICLKLDKLSSLNTKNNKLGLLFLPLLLFLMEHTLLCAET